MNNPPIRLIDPIPDLYQTFMRYREAFGCSTENYRLGALRFTPQDNFADAVAASLAARSQHDNLPEDITPHSIFWLVNQSDQMLGHVALRHELNEALTIFGGHIGYSVHPDHRNKGYATYMVKQMIPLAMCMNITRLLISCDVDNIASNKVIQKCGGILENTLTIPDRPVPLNRYWIDIEQ
ncbi:GNAT family N-acetyltransferase [Planctomycetota bacterium]|nr:GNAT family N-acetyltransferase [Planctomycetota bacterium]